MSDYTQALAAMITVAGGIVPDASYLAIHNSAERALRSWIHEITNQPPPLVSYRHQKCWRVITAFKNRGRVTHRFTDRCTYNRANKHFNTLTEYTKYPKIGTLIMCYIVAESDGIEMR